jgi:hypothetical protein
MAAGLTGTARLAEVWTQLDASVLAAARRLPGTESDYAITIHHTDEPGFAIAVKALLNKARASGEPTDDAM